MNTTRRSTGKKNSLKRRSSASSKPVRVARRPHSSGNGHTEGDHPKGNGTSSSSGPCQREQLHKERAHVVAELARLRAELLETPEATGDEVDLSVYDREKTLGLVKAFERRLEKLDNALRAAEAGQYGICQNCGQPIDAERLQIFPETRHCVKCKIQIEQQAKRRMMQAR